MQLVSSYPDSKTPEGLTFSALALCGRGEYGAAADLLGLTLGEWPKNVSSDRLTQGMALLASGIITSSLGGIQSEPVQGLARDMLCESIRLFGEDERSFVAKAWLAWCDYWEGEHDLALERIEESLQTPIDADTRGRGLLLRAEIYCARGLAVEAMNELGAMENLYELCGPLFRGKFHNQRGRALRLLNEFDRAILDYTSAAHAFEELGDVRCQAIATNNLAGVLCETGRFNEAHKHAGRAVRLFRELGDKAYEAQTLDQLAKIFTAQSQALVNESVRVVPECSAIREIKHVSVLELGHENVRLAPLPVPSRQPNLSREGCERMTPLECATELLMNQPDLASILFDLIVLIRTVRDDPGFEVELDEVEDLISVKIPDIRKQLKDYRRSRQIHLTTSRKES